mmetsp:Transcript_10604/g.17695  ORF Transcript_10604/g.17695 Transcript_10604/m.17695 type:complete len:481 (+) Transcript_10604:41-1483(+)
MSNIEFGQYVKSLDNVQNLYEAVGFDLARESRKGELRFVSSTGTQFVVKESKNEIDKSSAFIRIEFGRDEFVGSKKQQLLDAGWVETLFEAHKAEFVGPDKQVLKIKLTTDGGLGKSGSKSHSRGSTRRRHTSRGSDITKSRSEGRIRSLRRGKSDKLARSDRSLKRHEKHASPDDTRAPTSTTSNANDTDHNDHTKAAPSSSNTTTRDHPLQHGFHTAQGQRESNEDAHLLAPSVASEPSTGVFAVFDGHGGAYTSKYCEKHFLSMLEKSSKFATDKAAALKNTFVKLDGKLIDKLVEDGSTAVVAVLTGDNKLTVAHAGDSRAVLIPKAGDAVELTVDHKPTDDVEKARIEEAGHEVLRDTILEHGKRVHTHRVDGILAVARSLGDVNYKDSFDLPPEKQAVTCIPDICERQVESGDALVLACDGLFDVMPVEQLASIVQDAMQNENANLDELAEKLTTTAIEELGSDDNVSVIVVRI